MDPRNCGYCDNCAVGDYDNCTNKEPKTTTNMKLPSVTEQALRLADELDTGEFPEDMEPQYVAWVIKELLDEVYRLNKYKSK